NPSQYGLPAVVATILLNDAHTGALLAVMDGTWLTAMRTGAVGGVAAKYLARQDASVATVFGAGVQARTQLMAVCEARQIRKAYVYDLDRERGQAYAAAMSEQLHIAVIAADDPRDAVEAADILVAATSAHEPIFRGEWIRPGTHINGVGSHSPSARELDSETVRRALFVADQREACLAEAGDLILAIEEGALDEGHIHAELGQIVAGQVPGRSSDEQITLFKSVGLALQDVATAARVYALAQEQGLGLEIPL
ncbi:MAG: ornithine cyclodeaminase family protein, partial [Chloroflexia bacterium]|nr:ornithine cyclodeaminase family protein [Chloroflexia bacterium]